MLPRIAMPISNQLRRRNLWRRTNGKLGPISTRMRSRSSGSTKRVSTPCSNGSLPVFESPAAASNTAAAQQALLSKSQSTTSPSIWEMRGRRLAHLVSARQSEQATEVLSLSRSSSFNFMNGRTSPTSQSYSMIRLQVSIRSASMRPVTKSTDWLAAQSRSSFSPIIRSF